MAAAVEMFEGAGLYNNSARDRLWYHPSSTIDFTLPKMVKSQGMKIRRGNSRRIWRAREIHRF